MSPNETDVQFLARILWDESGLRGGFSAADQSRLYELAHNRDTPAPVEERAREACNQCNGSGNGTFNPDDRCHVCAGSGEEPKERVDGDALEMLQRYVDDDGVSLFPAEALEMLKSERARHAEELERLRCQIKMELDAGVRGRNDARERIAELENFLTESLISHGHDTPCAKMMAAGGALECECALPDGMRKQRHDALTRAEKSEAEAAELRERVISLDRALGDVTPSQLQVRGYATNREYSLRLKRRDVEALSKVANESGDVSIAVLSQLQSMLDGRNLEPVPETEAELRAKLEALQFDYDNLAGGGPDPGFGAEPRDSSRLSDLRSCIDTHGVFPSEEAEDAGDYEAAIRHMGEICQERSCMFSESHKLDVTRAPLPFLLKDPESFIGKHCRITVEALYPIGEAAEVVTAEGRDS